MFPPEVAFFAIGYFLAWMVNWLFGRAWQKRALNAEYTIKQYRRILEIHGIPDISYRVNPFI